MSNITFYCFTVLDVAEAISKTGLNNVPIWIMATVGLRQMDHLISWKRVFNGGVVLEPYLPELDQFQNYFQHALLVSQNLLPTYQKQFQNGTFLSEFSTQYEKLAQRIQSCIGSK